MNDLMKVLQSERFIPDNVRSTAIWALGYQFAVISASHERSRVLNVPNIVRKIPEITGAIMTSGHDIEMAALYQVDTHNPFHESSHDLSLESKCHDEFQYCTGVSIKGFTDHLSDNPYGVQR
jgi:hypothetical protein